MLQIISWQLKYHPMVNTASQKKNHRINHEKETINIKNKYQLFRAGRSVVIQNFGLLYDL